MDQDPGVHANFKAQAINLQRIGYSLSSDETTVLAGKSIVSYHDVDTAPLTCGRWQRHKHWSVIQRSWTAHQISTIIQRAETYRGIHLLMGLRRAGLRADYTRFSRVDSRKARHEYKGFVRGSVGITGTIDLVIQRLELLDMSHSLAFSTYKISYEFEHRSKCQSKSCQENICQRTEIIERNILYIINHNGHLSNPLFLLSRWKDRVDTVSKSVE